MRGLYPIVDLDTLAARGADPLEYARALLTAKPRLLQLRAKQQGPRSVLGLLGALKPLCEEHGTLLFANDRPDLALVAGAHGVHVGQDDMPIAGVRALSTTLQVGISTHDLSQLARALEQRPSYVAFGPIFTTRSKAGAEHALGLDALETAAQLAHGAQVPLVAIGGLTLGVAGQLQQAQVIAAVISDLLADGIDPAAVAARARAWQAALGAA